MWLFGGHLSTEERAPSSEAFSSSNTTSATYIGELLTSSTSATATNPFHYGNMTTLVNVLYGASGSLSTQVSSLKTSTASTPITAADLRAKTFNKSAGQSVIVRLGGLDWIVTYLSNDTSGNLIATLWLSNNHQEAWAGQNKNLGDHYGMVNGGLYSDWADDWDNSPTDIGTYPCNVYGTSYVRVEALNNPSNRKYATSSGSLKSGTSQSSSHIFALYTVSSKGLTSYLAKPNQMAWINNMQNPAYRYEPEYWWSNESLSTTSANGYNYAGSWDDDDDNYSGKTGYTNWGTDYLWLPSAAEVGQNDTYNGFWKISIAERSMYDATTSSITSNYIGSSQTNGAGTAECNTWTRSRNGHWWGSAYFLGCAGDWGGGNSVENSKGVRPCLLLNLTSAASHVQSSGLVVLTLNNQSATTPGTTNVTAANGATMPSIVPPTKIGYDFMGYYTATNGGGTKVYNANGQPENSTFSYSSNTTIYAYWQPMSVTVTLNSQSATTPGTSSVTAIYDASFPNISIPTRTNCCFGGYWTEMNGGGMQVYNSNGTSVGISKFTDNITLYALWKIDELIEVASLNSGNIYFNNNSLKNLVNMIYGANGDIGTQVTSLTSSTATTPLTSASLRAKTYSKTAGYSIIVRLGGLDWIVTYVSNDTDGNLIATLWLSNNHQEAWSSRNDNLGTHYGFVNGGLYSDWSDDWQSTDIGTYPSNMYGTSYVRSETLNNPNNRQYATSNSALSSTTSQSADHVFSLFTVANKGLTQHLVTPNKMAWINNMQNPANRNSSSYWFSNESLTDTNGYSYSGSWYSGSYNYSGYAGYSNWGSDYLWLPSYAEIGDSDSKAGMWEMSISERATYDGSTETLTVNSVGTSQTNYAGYAEARTMTRSASFTSSTGITGIRTSGSSSSQSYHVQDTYAVRPCLLLNLSSAATHIGVPVTLDDQSATTSGTTSVIAVNGSAMPTITVPTKTGYVFGGYYTGTNGSGTKYYTSTGASAKNCDFNTAKTLYAYWMTYFNITATGSTTQFTYTQSYDTGMLNFMLMITPATGHRVSQISFNNTDWIDIEYCKCDIGGSAYAINTTYIVSEQSNALALKFEGWLHNFDTSGSIPIYIKTASGAYSGLKQTSSVSGVAVQATFGGMVRMIGEDFDSLGDNDTITLSADVTQNGYGFKHWITADGTVLSTAQSVHLQKSLVNNSVVIAVFEPVSSSNVNLEVDNTE